MSQQSRAEPEGDRRSSSEKTVPVSVDPERPTEKSAPVPPVDYPEGLRAWGVVLGVWLLQFVTFGYTNSHGIYTDYYNRIYLSNYDPSAVSWIGGSTAIGVAGYWNIDHPTGSTQLMLTLCAGLLTGRAFDAGYFYALAIGGSILFTFCLFMLSLTHAQQYYQVFLSQGLGLGMSIGLIYVPTLGIVSHHFLKSRTLALGVASSGSAVGGLIHPILLNNLINSSLGFHNAVRISAAMNAGLLIMGTTLMQTRLPPSDKKANIIFHIRTFFKEPEYVITVLGMFFVLLGVYFPIFFLQLNNIKNGIDPTLSFYTTSILNACSAIGRVIPTYLAQRVGIFNMIIAVTLLCAVLIFIVQVIKTAAATIVFCILFGFSSGAYVGLLAPILGFLAKDVSEIGSRMGIGFTITGFAGLVGTPIAGALLGVEYHWIRPILFAGIIVAVGTCSFFTARLILVKQRHTQLI